MRGPSILVLRGSQAPLDDRAGKRSSMLMIDGAPCATHPHALFRKQEVPVCAQFKGGLGSSPAWRHTVGGSSGKLKAETIAELKKKVKAWYADAAAMGLEDERNPWDPKKVRKTDEGFEFDVWAHS
jgi:hypothetical protein